jgi:hypothetical protein
MSQENRSVPSRRAEHYHAKAEKGRTDMSAADDLVRSALAKVKDGNVDAGLEMIKALHDEDPKPVLFHYAAGLVQQQKGELARSAGAFRAFSQKLGYKHLEKLGLTTPGDVDPESLQLLAGPDKIRNAQKKAKEAFAAGDWKTAVDNYSVEIEWRIHELKKVGLDVFGQ